MAIEYPNNKHRKNFYHVCIFYRGSCTSVAENTTPLPFQQISQKNILEGKEVHRWCVETLTLPLLFHVPSNFRVTPVKIHGTVTQRHAKSTGKKIVPSKHRPFQLPNFSPPQKKHAPSNSTPSSV